MHGVVRDIHGISANESKFILKVFRFLKSCTQLECVFGGDEHFSILTELY